MELIEAQDAFNKIVDICYDLANERMIEIVESIYPDIEAAEDTADIIAACEEIQVALGEIDFLPDEEDFVFEIRELIDLINE